MNVTGEPRTQCENVIQVSLSSKFKTNIFYLQHSLYLAPDLCGHWERLICRGWGTRSWFSVRCHSLGPRIVLLTTFWTFSLKQ